MSNADRSLTRALRSFPAISTAARTGPAGPRMAGSAEGPVPAGGCIGAGLSVTKRPAGEMEEHCLKIRFGDRDRPDRRP